MAFFIQSDLFTIADFPGRDFHFQFISIATMAYINRMNIEFFYAIYNSIAYSILLWFVSCELYIKTIMA